MKKNVKTYFLILASLVAATGCNRDIEDIESAEKSNVAGTDMITSRNCMESLSFQTKITSFAKFDAPAEELTIGEQNLALPKVEHRTHYICKRSDGSIISEIASNPNLESHTDYPDYTLGAPRKIEWRAVNDDGLITVYDADGATLSSEAAEVPFDENADILASYQAPLQDQTTYDAIISAMEQHMQIEELNEHLVAIVTTTTEGTSKIYLDKRYQRQVALENYSTDGILLTRTSHLYDNDNGVITLKNKTFQAWKESMDSERMMTMVKLTSYTYN